MRMSRRAKSSEPAIRTILYSAAGKQMARHFTGVGPWSQPGAKEVDRHRSCQETEAAHKRCPRLPGHSVIRWNKATASGTKTEGSQKTDPTMVPAEHYMR